MLEDINYCQRCGHALAEKRVEGKLRPACPSCGLVVFLDPKVAAVALVSLEGGLVMIKRTIEPAIGRWSVPSGYVDRGEAVEDAAVREVKEETGLDVRLTAFVCLYSRTGSPVVLAAYSAEVIGGELYAGSEASDARMFGPDALPPLPFPSDGDILRDWGRITTEGTEDTEK